MARFSLDRLLLAIILLSAVIVPSVSAQTELAASLEVLEAGVEVKLTGSVNWIPIKFESLIGQGDAIRTNATGKARITFFKDGASAELEPNTEYQVIEFNGDKDQFQLTVEVLAGITRQQFGRLLDAGSSYNVRTPGAAMTVRGTTFSVRVEDDGRSSVLTAEGLVEASSEQNAAEIPAGMGVRSEVGQPLSDVVPATTFETLDAGLDGCTGQIMTEADVKVNVRLGPGQEFEHIGSIYPDRVAIVNGSNALSSWYRIPFRNGFGWVSAAGLDISIQESCAELPIYSDDYTEDITRYVLVGDPDIFATVNARTANLRSGPSTTYEKVGLVDPSDELRVLGRTEDATWLQVQTIKGQVAWVASYLVRVDTDLTYLNVITAEQFQELSVPAEAEETGADDITTADTTNDESKP